MNRIIRITNVLLSVIAALALYLLSSVSYAGGSWNGWIYQDPYPTSTTLNAVKFVTPLKGWVAGEQGIILHTGDGGDTWEIQESGIEQTLTSITFVNEKAGWAAVSDGTIIHTVDGGKAWIKQIETKTPLKSVFFLNEKEGWAAGAERTAQDNNIGGVILHTIDSGKNWQRLNANIQRAVVGITFINSKVGWVLAGDEVHRTYDGGQTWEKSKLNAEIPHFGSPDRPYDGPDIFQVWSKGELTFVDDRNGWAVVGFGSIMHTTDGGKTWKNQNITSTLAYGLSHISFSDPRTGCAVGSSILCTEDGGQTWKEKLGVPAGSGKRINDFMVDINNVSFIGQSIGWAVGLNGQIWKTEDGGRNWKLVSRRDECGNHVYFINKKTGWFYHRLDYAASLCRTDDGGITRQKQDVGMNVWALYFKNTSIGWAVGTIEERSKENKIEKVYGVIKQTSNGGKTWKTRFIKILGKTRMHTDLTSVTFVNSDVGWTVGRQGIILHTEDAGRSWLRQDSLSSKVDLNDIQFIGSKTGWIAGIKSDDNGWTGVIIHTQDGGNHWVIQHTIKDFGLTAVFFNDNKRGWVTGLSESGGAGLLMHTEDGGSTWQKEEFGDIGYSDVAFLDKQHGVLSTDKELIFSTTDGGKTWKKMRRPLRKYPWHFSEIFGIEQKGN